MTAIIAQESSGKPYEISTFTNKRTGVVGHAYGLMQIIPSTGKALGVDDIKTASIDQNIQAGANYLAYLLTRYDGNEQLAMAAYNAGPGAVDRHGGVPLNGNRKETQNYVANVSLMETWVAETYTGATPTQMAKSANNDYKRINEAFTPWWSGSFER